MNRKLLVLSILTAFALLGIAYEAQSPTTAASTQPAVAPSHQVGLIINVDPETGVIIEEPAPGASKIGVPAELANAWSTSDEGLVEVPNTSGKGGMIAHLQGRFEAGMVATVDANGKLVAPCAQGLTHTADHSASQK
jgi:hypothetical protein